MKEKSISSKDAEDQKAKLFFDNYEELNIIG
jgi:hypothetical protein